MKIKPVGDRILLKQFEAEEKTKSGIILTSSTKEKPSIFEVVTAGDGVMNDGTEVKMFLKQGDKVICNKFSGMTVKVDEEELVVVSQNDILAIVEDL